MSLSFYYISNGRMYRFEDGKAVELRSGVLDSYVLKVKDSAERNEWKYSGSGAAFTGTFQHRINANDAVKSIFSVANCIGEHKGDVIYSIDIDNTNGIYRKSESDTSEGIVLCSSSTAYRDFDIRGDLMVTTADFAGESHIGILNLETKSFNIYTEGHSVDSSPVWSLTDSAKVYFCCSGLPENDNREREENDAPRGISQMVNEMYSAARNSQRGPSSICVLDIMAGTLDEILANDRYDYTHPESTSDGSLYYIRKPYKTGGGAMESLGCLADIFLLPVRLFEALFGFLNVFSAKYSGKTLSRSDVKRRDEKEMFIDGNLINAEKELRDNQRRGDKNPGIIPRSWELRLLDINGNDTLIKSGVAAFKVNTQTGDILVSNGSSILRIDKDGKEEKLLSAEGVVFIK